MNKTENWPIVTLGNHCDILTGYPFKSSGYTDDPSDIPLIRGYNIVQGKLRWEDMKRWPASEYEKYREYQLQPGDIVLAMDRPWIEAGLKYAWIRDQDVPCLLVQRVARLRGRNGLTTDFLRYIVAQREFSEYLRAIVTGVNVPHISMPQIRSFKFVLPPDRIQKRIASVLSAYDSLIENNRRRIQVLEEIARAIYREWFVHFRFPGHEEVEMVDSEMGEIPEGWKTLHFGEICENFDRKRVPLSEMKRKEMKGPFPYYGATGTLDYVNDYLFEGRYLLIAEDGSVSVEGGYPMLQLVTGKFWVNNHAHVVQGLRPLSTEFLYLLMSNTVVSGYITGAVQLKLSQTNLNGIPVLVPPTPLIERFDLVAGNIFDLTENLRRQSAALQQMRDLLLPRLVSGQMHIPIIDADASTSDAHQTSKYKEQLTLGQWTDGDDQDADMGR